MQIKFPKIDLTGVKAVMLDIDDTLYLYKPAHEYALEKCYNTQMANYYNYEDFLEKYKASRKYVTQNLYPQGACRSRLFAFQKIFMDLHVPCSYLLANKMDHLYWKFLISQIELEADAADFLQQCKEKNVKICIVTDMFASIQIKKLEKLNITDYIAYLVSSEEAGEEKPSALIFNLALQRLKTESADTIMVGDSLVKDIQGAEALGIRAYQVEHIA